MPVSTICVPRYYYVRLTIIWSIGGNFELSFCLSASFAELDRGLDAAAAAENALQAAKNLYNPNGTRAELEGSLEAVGMEQLSGSPEADLRAQVAEMQKNYIAEGYKLLAMSHMQQKNLKPALEAVNESLKIDGSSMEVKELKMKIQDEIISNT